MKGDTVNTRTRTILTLPVIAAAAIAIPATDAAGSAPTYFANSISSNRPLSFTDVEPARAGHIYSIAIGKAGTGYGIYAPSGCSTRTLRKGGTVWVPSVAGAWNFDFDAAQYTVKVTC